MTKPNLSNADKQTDNQVLYRFWQDDILLYIGISNQFFGRVGQHKDTKDWFHLANKITLQHYPDRKSVLKAEKTAIYAEKPIHNKIHNLSFDNGINHFYKLEKRIENKWYWLDNHELFFAVLKKIVDLNRLNKIAYQHKLKHYFYAKHIGFAYEIASKYGFECENCRRMISDKKFLHLFLTENSISIYKLNTKSSLATIAGEKYPL